MTKKNIKEIKVPEEVLEVVSDSIDKSIEAVEAANEEVKEVEEVIEEEPEEVLTLVDEYKKAYDTLYELYEPYKLLEIELDEIRERNNVLQDKIKNVFKDFKLDELLNKARYEKELEANRQLFIEKTAAYNEAKEKHDAYFAETNIYHYNQIDREYNEELYTLKVEAAKESLYPNNQLDKELNDARNAYIDAMIAAREAREKLAQVFSSKRDEYFGKLTEYENSKPMEMRVTPETLGVEQISSWSDFSIRQLYSNVQFFKDEEKIQRYRDREGSLV